MGIVVEDIKFCVSRIVYLSRRVSHRFVQKHPCVSGALLFLFILYIFLPSVLSFLFYSLPFFGLTVVLLAFWTSKRSSIRGEKVEEDKKLEVPKQPTATINRNRSIYFRNATSRRQRFRDKSQVWREEAPINASVESDYSKLLIEVKETQPLDSGNKASAHSTTSVDKAIEVSSKNEPILGSELVVKPDLVACDGAISQTNKSDSGGDETKNESSEDPEDEDEEEAQEDRNKAVEWTEDDQKNLMDLGLSEMERNRRLENLIARRRARKLYKRKNDEATLIADILPLGQIPKIITARNDPLDLGDGCKEIEGIPLPGSAPSVLLPMRNPFDLPYDPHEEKPNLMADSFQQEFTAAHQKELAFCRHESFCFGPPYPEETGALGYHRRYRRPSISIADKGEHDWLIEQLLFKSDQVPHAEKLHIAVETRGIQTEDLPLARDVNAMELESDQEKGIPPDSESEFEMEPELIQDVNSPSSHSSSLDNPEDVICDDVRVVSKNFESTLNSALNKSFNSRVPKGRLIREPLCEFSPMAFDKNKMEERFPYQDKVACHTPTYSIASDLQVEVSEIGSPPNVDGNNTDAESLNPDWEIEKEASFGGEQDDMSPMSKLRSIEVSESDSQEGEEVKALSVTEASPPKTVQSPMVEELVDDPSQVVPQMPEELSILTDDDDEEAINHIFIDQKDAEALTNMKHTVKTREENVDGGLEILIKQEDDERRARSLKETVLKSSKSSNDGSEDSSGCLRSDLDHEHLEEGTKNMDQITGNGDLGQAHEQSEEGNKNVDQTTGNGDLVEPRRLEEQLELIQDNKNQPTVVETEFQSSKDASKLPVEDESVAYGGAPLDSNGILRSDASQNQVNDVHSEFQKSIDALKSTVEQDSVVEREVLDTRTGLSPEYSIEEQVHTNKVSISQDSIISPENNPKTMEKDGREKTDQNLNSPNSALNDDLKTSEITLQKEVAANPVTETTGKEVETETELTPTTLTNKNMEADEDNDKNECKSHRFNKQEESGVAEERDLEFDKDMENYSKDLNGHKAEGNPSKLRAIVMGLGLKRPTYLAHENPVESSLTADKGGSQ